MFLSANHSPYLAEGFTAIDKARRKSFVVLVRATYDVDADGHCRLSERQSPFDMNGSGTFCARLPRLSVPVSFMFDDRTRVLTVTPDTLVLLPHEGRVVLLGRARAPLPCQFTRLREALQEAGLAMHDVDFRLGDVAGESYAFEELALAQARLMRKVRPGQPLWHAADCIGDCGAAAGLIQFAWAGQAFHRGYAPGPVAALQAASPFGLRAAAVVATPEGLKR